MIRKLMVAGFVALIVPAVAQADTFRVNYRSNAAAPWQWSSTTQDRGQANAQAATLQQEGYQSEVVTIQTNSRPFTTYTVPGAVVTGGTWNWYGSSVSGTGGWGWHGTGHHGWHHGGHRHHAAHHHAHHGHHGGHHR